MKNELSPGTFTPDFTFSRSDGSTRLLSVFRNSACALCNLRIRHFIRRYEEWRSQGLEVVAVFESRETSLSLHVGR